MKRRLSTLLVVALVPAVGGGPAAAEEPGFAWSQRAQLSEGGPAHYAAPYLGSVLEEAADGDLLAGWVGESGDVLLRRSPDAGSTWGPIFRVPTPDGEWDRHVAVAGSTSSVLVVTQRGDDLSSDRTAYYTRLGDDGTVGAVPGPVVETDAGNAVAATAGGYVMLHDVEGSVVAVASHDDGRTFGGPVPLGALTSGWDSSNATYDITAVGDDVTVAWAAGTGSDASGDVVMTRRSTDGGRTWLPAVPTDIVGSPNLVSVAALGGRRVVAAYADHPEQGPFATELHVTDTADAGATWTPALMLGPGDPGASGHRHVGLAPTEQGFVVSTWGTAGQFYETVSGSGWEPTGIPGHSLPAAVADGTLHVLRGSTFSSYLPLPPAGPAPLQAQPSAAGRDVEDACPAARVPAAGFQDVPVTAAHSRSIDCVVWWEVARGRTATQYAPASPVTRGQMATFIAGAIEQSGDVLPEASRDWFGDDDGTTHERNINRLAEADVLAGRAPGVYSPAAPVSRGAMAKFLALSYEYTSGDELPDHVDYFADDTGHVQELFINKAASTGMAAGVGDGYAPGGDVRRDQMGTFIARWLDLVVERFAAPLPGEA